MNQFRFSKLHIILLCFSFSCKSEQNYLIGNYELTNTQDRKISIDFKQKKITTKYVNITSINSFKMKKIDSNSFLLLSDIKILKNKQIEGKNQNEYSFQFEDKGNEVFEIHALSKDLLKYRITYSKNLEETVDKGILIKK